ncbi:MAG: cytochrome P450 [Pseudomonadota bacterium]|nr:cytochrome P450 [Pseudomonadota bacterium]
MDKKIKTPNDYNLLDPVVIENPYEAYEVYRSQSPVYKSPETGFYVVTKYSDLKRVLTDYDFFSRDIAAHWEKDVKNRKKGYWKHGNSVSKVFQEKGWRQIPCFGAEPPNHTRFRKAANPSFTAGRVKKMEPYIINLINELIDTFIDDGEVEFVSQFCIPLPMNVIQDRLGFPKEDLPKLKGWSQDTSLSLSQMLTEEEEIACAERLVEFQHYMNDTFEEKRKSPKEDIISDLVSYMDEDGNHLKTEELLSIVSDLNIGGNETTTDSLASGMLMLMQQRDKLDDLLSGKAKLKNFIEEIIRLETPVQSLFRRVRKDVEVSGVNIPEGSIIDMRFGSANRDEDQFECPAKMDLKRKNPGKHLAYGTAHHHCIGAPLARQEMKFAFEILLERLKNINLAEDKNDLLHRSHFALRGLNKLHLTFERA